MEERFKRNLGPREQWVLANKQSFRCGVRETSWTEGLEGNGAGGLLAGVITLTPVCCSVLYWTVILFLLLFRLRGEALSIAF